MNGDTIFDRFGYWSLWKYGIKSPIPSLCVRDAIKIYKITEK